MYKELLQERFEEVLDDPMAELKELREKEGITEYHAKFELIRTRLKLSEEYLLSAYLAGLRLETQMHVCMFQPQNIRQCLVLGRLYEKAHPRKPGGNRWSSSKKSFSGSNQSKGIIPFKKEEVVKGKDNNPPLRKFLTSAEMSERRAKGLCYYCDEKYTPDHYLKLLFKNSGA